MGTSPHEATTLLADRSLHELLDEVAAQTPAPGGGCATAWACALGASLVEMAASFALGRANRGEGEERLRVVGARASGLRLEALALGERELRSYAPVLEALRLPAADPERRGRLADALARASDAPLRTAEAAASVAELGAELVRTGSPHLRGDALAGTLLAEASCRSALALVALNLADQPDDGGRERREALAQRAERARREALA
jgi:formiminotetrahydrofolate cyclodeaminase